MKGKLRSILQKGFVVIAIALIIIGAMQGGFNDTKNKAIRICYECIGIG